MLRTILALCLAATPLIPTNGVAAAQPPHSSELITYVNSPPSSPPTLRQAQDTALGGTEGGRIAVRLTQPSVPRYPEGAPIVVHTSTFFTPGQGFGGLGVTRTGAIEVSYLWPGTADASTGASSEGVYDPLILKG